MRARIVTILLLGSFVAALIPDSAFGEDIDQIMARHADQRAVVTGSQITAPQRPARALAPAAVDATMASWYSDLDRERHETIFAAYREGEAAADSSGDKDRLNQPVRLATAGPVPLQLNIAAIGALASDEGSEGADPAPSEDTGDDATGTDPRGFSNKFMPYYTYMKMKNDIEVQQLNLFGMFAFGPDIAITYDFPVLKYVDYSDLDAFKTATGGIPPGQGGSGIPGGGVPLSDLESDGDNIGVGDLNLRLFAKIGLDGNITEEDTWMIMPLIETTLPTASDDVLGGESWLLSPGFTAVIDIPGKPPFGLGFVALMNFYDFDLVKDDSRAKTRRFRGRWFWMQPLTPPEMGALGGLYVLTEFQPIYDFETDDFDLFIAPEFGKIIKDGFIIYAKPGFGIDPDDEDREYTLEIGTRIFF